MLININGNNLFYEHQNDFENRPTMVFLHDSLGCVELWRDFPKKIAESCQCNILIYDRLGYGKSDAMPTYIRPIHYLELEAVILNDLVEKLSIESPILFGHSDGGSIALIAAAKYPNKINGVICEAAHIFVEDITLNGIRKAVEAYQTTNLAAKLQKYHGDKTQTIFKAWTETWLREDFRKWNIESLLPQIQCPLLFIQGKNDEYGTLNQVERTIKLVHGKSQKHILPDIGHTPHKVAPKSVIDMVKKFTTNY
ncbi:pimeloyl-ACP methyl ester carboxylesterase [Flavobacterium nitrogenifigens]|uniref:Pimeloyl-ACP methyl ester carboxylesterase n=2 Tax=Flavobacterium TaxID=237 RepID=A0A7W7ISZ8_9FLAO|nr:MULTISPECIES: alpha/beta hydrolase [Flavobacterium]MBB4799988.1 pimeloyl-ACP methyl ester carboxylesterase [Flavobacterium nitrogenifigens]MBB6386262.1 pimeloyl-ACP methyl ester carboxylesterase [Flavobacterium notoginsengisoli]